MSLCTCAQESVQCSQHLVPSERCNANVHVFLELGFIPEGCTHAGNYIILSGQQLLHAFVVDRYSNSIFYL